MLVYLTYKKSWIPDVPAVLELTDDELIGVFESEDSANHAIADDKKADRDQVQWEPEEVKWLDEEFWYETYQAQVKIEGPHLEKVA